jgi:glycosyltransferase involved in cell wall biosynthesis
VTTIHAGVDPERFTPEADGQDLRAELSIARGTFLAGILGRLGPLKGHDDFLDAARLALGQGVDVSFVILVKEPSPRETDLRSRVASDSHLRERVRFVGRRDNLPAVLRSFDLGIVASTGSEANCRAGLEWMASGVPLLATEVGVLPDIVLDGATGFLVPPSSPKPMAEKIAHLAVDRAEARRMGEAARRRVLDHFTLGHCAETHLAFLRPLVRGPKGEQPRN